jgi:hypothetical protein
MPHAMNGRDGTQVYFEDDGGAGAPVVLHGGLLDSVADVRESEIAQRLPGREFRHIYVDHRGLGQSDKPHHADAYAMQLRVQMRSRSSIDSASNERISSATRGEVGSASGSASTRIVLEEADHYAAHMSQNEVVLDAILRTLREGTGHR